VSVVTIELKPSERDAIRAMGGTAYVGVIDWAGKQRRRTPIYRSDDAAKKALEKVKLTTHSVMGVFAVDEHGDCIAIDDGDDATTDGFPLVRIGQNGRELHVQMPDGRARCEHQEGGSVSPYLRQGNDLRPGHRFDGGAVSEAFPTGMTGRPTCADCLALIEAGATP
jgi:hypothetical protein